MGDIRSSHQSEICVTSCSFYLYLACRIWHVVRENLGSRDCVLWHRQIYGEISCFCDVSPSHVVLPIKIKARFY